MAVSIDERRAILTELERRGETELAKLWKLAEGSSDFRTYLLAAYPELAAVYGEIAGGLAATWFEDALSLSRHVARIAAPPESEHLAKSASWALNVGNANTALDLLAGSMQRAMWQQARDTTEFNAELEGSTFARHASANACGFCRMLATRGAVYGSAGSAGRVGGGSFDLETGRRLPGGRRTRGSRAMGKKFHDHCHCVVIEVRAGQTYEPPPYVERWADDKTLQPA